MDPSITTSTPWDPAELKGRECVHCACYFESVNPEDPAKYQGFCRRAPAEVSQARVQVPRLDPVTKLPQVRNGQPVMNNEVVTGFLYKPVQRSGTCFDGYRPKGTLPGDKGHDPHIRQFLAMLVDKCTSILDAETRAEMKKLLGAGPEQVN